MRTAHSRRLRADRGHPTAQRTRSPGTSGGIFWAVAALAVILVGVLIWLIVSVNDDKDTNAQQDNGSGQPTTSQSQDANGTTQRGGKTKNDATDASDGEDMSDDTDAFECDANGYCRMKNYGHYAPDYDKMMNDNSGA